MPPSPTARAQVMCRARKISGCGSSSATSISARRVIILVAVAGDAAEIADEMRAFEQALIITFRILAAVLLLTTMFQVRFGLAPLKRITDSLAAIRAGRAERLAGDFPARDRAARARNQRADRSQQEKSSSAPARMSAISRMR